MTSRLTSFTLLISLFWWSPLGRSAPIATVKDISVHLLLTPSGELSPDVSEMKDFYSWNFFPFSNDLPRGQRFNSFLVKVRLDAGTETFLKGRLGTFEVRSIKRGRILSRQVISDVYIPREGGAVVGFFVQGRVCEPVLITANIGTSHITKELKFECGE